MNHRSINKAAVRVAFIILVTIFTGCASSVTRQPLTAGKSQAGDGVSVAISSSACSVDWIESAPSNVNMGGMAYTHAASAGSFAAGAAVGAFAALIEFAIEKGQESRVERVHQYLGLETSCVADEIEVAFSNGKNALFGDIPLRVATTSGSQGRQRLVKRAREDGRQTVLSIVAEPRYSHDMMHVKVVSYVEVFGPGDKKPVKRRYSFQSPANPPIQAYRNAMYEERLAEIEEKYAERILSASTREMRRYLEAERRKELAYAKRNIYAFTNLPDNAWLPEDAKNLVTEGSQGIVEMILLDMETPAASEIITLNTTCIKAYNTLVESQEKFILLARNGERIVVQNASGDIFSVVHGDPLYTVFESSGFAPKCRG